MALFDIIIPQLVNAAQSGEQALERLMDQDWNHWKLQVQSWMEDAKETSGQPGPSAAPPTCGASARRGQGCCGRPNASEDQGNPLDALHQMWTQFANAGQQRGRGCRRSQKEASTNQVQNEQRKYVIKLDVQHFEPTEISVKIVDKQIVVDGEHPERSDRMGLVSRKFQRKYELPSDVEPNTIVSTLTPSGVLIIEGLKKRAPTESEDVVVIPVIREHTNSSEETNSSTDDQNEYKNDQQMD